jgi:hypothetical protein
MKKYAFCDSLNTVVQCFVAELTSEQVNQFVNDYSSLLKTTSVHQFDESNPVWIGWTIIDGVPVKPQPEIIQSEEPTE